MAETTTIHARCHCNSFTLTLSYANADLPHARSLCLCSSCRRMSGTSAGGSYIPLPGAMQEEPPSTSRLTAYNTSGRITRYFCSTCGAHALAYIADLKRWSVATGLLSRTEGIVQWRGCKYLDGTLDGGVSDWLVGSTGGKEGKLNRYLGQDTAGLEIAEGDQGWKKTETIAKGNETLKAACHCGGVKLHVTRPTAASRSARSAFPDLMIPFHSRDAASENPQNDPWFLRSAETKYLAGTCTCTSCRRNLGFEIQTWAFVPRVNIVRDSVATLRKYHSKEDVVRSFCATCGASVFWEGLFRMDVVDISTGLFDPEQGARVEDWLYWWSERVSYKEDAVSTSLVECLGEGLRRWGEEKRAKGS